MFADLALSTVAVASSVAAQAMGIEPLWGQLVVAYGPMAVMLWWFAQRAEKRSDRLERRMESMERVQLMALLSRQDAPDQVKREARRLLREQHGYEEEVEP